MCYGDVWLRCCYLLFQGMVAKHVSVFFFVLTGAFWSDADGWWTHIRYNPGNDDTFFCVSIAELFFVV